MDTLLLALTFLSGILSFLMSLFALTNNLLDTKIYEMPPPHDFLVTVIHTFLILLALLALLNDGNSGLIGRLFPHLWGMRNQGRYVWVLLERNPNIYFLVLYWRNASILEDYRRKYIL